MTNNITVKQTSTIGSDTTQIAMQHNHYGLTPTEASQLAIDLFMQNFPKLQEQAMNIVQERIDELIKEIISKIEVKYAGNYSAFSDPDMQYILIEAEKGYARKGTFELCNILSSLIADRSACKENTYLEMIMDKAIELVPNLLPSQLDYLTLIFLYKYVCFEGVNTLEKLQRRFEEIHDCFIVQKAESIIPYLDMLGLLTINLGQGDDFLAKIYGFEKQEITKILPSEYLMVSSDYGLTPVGILLAIFNANIKGKWKFDLYEWITN